MGVYDLSLGVCVCTCMCFSMILVPLKLLNNLNRDPL